jgi:LacI family transcriptional regulator
VPSLGEGEKRQLGGLLADGIHGLIVVPGNPRVVAPLIHRAEAKGVRVVCVSSDAPGSRRSTVVCVNPELNGRLAAELLAKLVPQPAEVAVVTGMLRTEDHRRKVEGFRAGFAQHSPEGKIAAILEAHESEQESYRKTSELLGRHPDLRGIYVSTVNCLPVCRAVREHQRARQLRLIATDLFPEMVPYFETGTIGASIYQDPYTQGRNAMRILVDHLLEKTPIGLANYLNPGIVLLSNLRLFRELR